MYNRVRPGSAPDARPIGRSSTIAASGTHTVTVPQHVLVQEMDGESVLLNLDSGRYFGLDQTGTSIWAAVTETNSIEAGFERLQREFDVNPDRLMDDIRRLLDQLVAHDLLRIEPR